MKSTTKPKSVDAYIADQPAGVRPRLEKMRAIVHKHAPDAEEVISYGMPAYKLHGMLLYFAAFTNHCSLFAFPTTNAAFKERLKPYETSKGTVKFPNDKPIPVRLIDEMVKFKVAENINNHAIKELAKAVKKKK